MSLTLISHFYNEEFLLPHWLRHHTRLFDHGILIDYASTDRSVEICRELAPHWEVRPSEHEWFSAELLDEQVKAIEREVPGWKMALNTTEMVFHPNLHMYLNALDEEVNGVSFSSYIMVDQPARRHDPIDPEQPLYLQKFHGYYDEGQHVRRTRLLHRYPDGNYHIGRHGSNHPSLYDPETFILWWGWSPIESVKSRKLQIQTRIPALDRFRGWGREHLVNEEQLEANYQTQVDRSQILLGDPVYVDALERLVRKFSLGDPVDSTV
jgi:hypothetical protein